MRLVRGLAASLLLAHGVATADVPRVAIIIDDLGYHLSAGRRAIRLPGPVSFSFLPFAPRAAMLAQAAHDAGKEVLLHLPLQAASAGGRPEPAEINLDMTRRSLGTTFSEALASVPYVIGINSHRGSLLTRHPGQMRWLMEEIGAHEGLFFIDSYTTHLSVALQIAHEAGIDAAKRDVFLDPDRSPETVAREFERLKQLARQRGRAIAIGHPYPATLELLERELPKLEADGIELVTVSDILR